MAASNEMMEVGESIERIYKFKSYIYEFHNSIRCK